MVSCSPAGRGRPRSTRSLSSETSKARAPPSASARGGFAPGERATDLISSSKASNSTRAKPSLMGVGVAAAGGGGGGGGPPLVGGGGRRPEDPRHFPRAGGRAEPPVPNARRAEQ